MMIRIAAAAACLFACISTGAEAQQAKDSVRIGFRADARPFSYQTPGGQYQGFLVDLCRAAFSRSGYEIEEVAVEAADRFELLSLDAAEGGVDMLCDPTSISPRTAADYLLSPQVFATGVGYLRHVRLAAEETGAADGVVTVGYLKGTTAGTAVAMADARGDFRERDDSTTRTAEASTHVEGINRVCDGTYDYYFGDLDILRALKQQVERDGVDCSRVRDSGATIFSYEAYALAVDKTRPDVAVALQAGLFLAFSDGTARRSYDEHFNGNRRTDPLQAVFALNNVFPCGMIAPDPCASAPGN